ncbi:hypothetical protein [Porticoccus sp.]
MASIVAAYWLGVPCVDAPLLIFPCHQSFIISPVPPLLYDEPRRE